MFNLKNVLINFYLICFFTIHANSQSAMGGWTFHVNTSNALQVEKIGSTLFTAYKNGILEYDMNSKEKSILNATNGLSDVEISCLGVVGDALIIGYTSGNIDIYKNSTFTSISAIRLAQIQGSKKILQIIPFGNDCIIATGFGLVQLNLSKNEVKDTYFPKGVTEEINSVAIFQDSIYATNGQVVYTAYTKSNFLSNPNQWRTNKDFKTANNARFAQLLTVGENLCVLKKGNTTGKDSVFQYKANALEILTDFSFDINIQSISSLDNKLGLNLMDGIIGFNQDFIGIAYVLQKLNENTILNVNHSLFHEGKVYAGTVNNGLVELDPSGGGSKVSFEGPARNTYWRMSTGKDLLLVSGGGLNGNFSTYNPNGNYLLKDGSWSLLNRETVPEWNDKIIYDFIGSAINPITGEFAISTYSHEPVTTFDAQGNVKGVFNPNNSTLEYTVLGNGNSYVSDMVYDDNGNLWSLNGYAAEGLLKCLSKEGNWYSYSLGANTIGFRTEELVMDYNGNLWASVLNKGLVGYNFGGTVDNLSDDKRINLDVGETTGALPSNLVNTIAVDFDNEIWIGTDNGFAILYNSQGAFDAVPGEYNAQRIKLEFEGNVEFLLGSTSITSIVVDGGNRKWLGTAGAGVFCLSPDGLQILENFTSENSPLISDFIVDMEMDHNTGELYIITDKGLVSTRVDASYEDPDYEDVVVFPNPAGPNFSGPITIQGIKFDSDVKITDAGGNLVYRTTSNGGTATWNGKTLEGEKAVTGIYYIWTASNEQKGRKVAKVALINAQ